MGESESRFVDLIDLSREHRGSAELRITIPGARSGYGSVVSLELDVDDQHVKGMGSDCFEAFQQLRSKLSSRGLDLNCYGSCVNVQPSLLARDRDRGRLACQLELGETWKEAELVDIFDRPDGEYELGSPDEQKVFLNRWRKSLIHYFRVIRVRIEQVRTEDSIELIIADFLKNHVIRKYYSYDKLLREQTLRVRRKHVTRMLEEISGEQIEQLPCRAEDPAFAGDMVQFQIVNNQTSCLKNLLNPVHGDRDKPNIMDVIYAVALGSKTGLFIRSFF